MTDSLCTVCQHINIKREFFIYSNEDDIPENDLVKPLGRLGSILEKSWCPLCRLIAATIGGSSIDLSKEEVRDIQCTLAWEINGRVYDWNVSKGVPDDSAEPELVPRTRCLRAYPETFVESMNEGDHITLLCDEDATDGMLLGRAWSSDQVDFGVIKSWLEACHELHSGCDATVLPASQRTVEAFKLIDVENNCIVDATVDVNYFTLSYVWGGKNTFLTTLANIDEFRKNGALKDRISNIPTTIADAMALVAALGYRYLWVDSICIVQDDMSTKQVAIENMDLVYARSLCTIIAGSGNDAQSGLPGVRPHTRGCNQVIEQVENLKLMFPGHLDDYFSSQVYDTRAWTYQERQLSNRILFFIGGQAIYQCQVATWREDTVSDLSVMTDSLHIQDSFRLITASSSPGFVQYMGIVHHYSARHLSYETDILNAFKGVSSILSLILRTAMHWGLPKSLFDWALLWEAKGYVKRRSCCPSWSWTGYVGNHVLRTHEDKSLNRMGHLGMPQSRDSEGDLTQAQLDVWLRTHTWIQWFYYDEGNSTPQLLNEVENAGPNMHYRTTHDGKRRRLAEHYNTSPINDRWSHLANSLQTQPTIHISEDLLAVHNSSTTKIEKGAAASTCTDSTMLTPELDRSGILHFWTVWASFYVKPLPTRDGDDEEYTSIAGLRCYGIYDNRGVLSGDFWVREDWKVSVDNVCELLVLSDALPSYGEMEEYTEEQYQRYVDDVLIDASRMPGTAEDQKGGEHEYSSDIDEDNNNGKAEDDDENRTNGGHDNINSHNPQEYRATEDTEDQSSANSTSNDTESQATTHMWHLHNVILVEPRRNSSPNIEIVERIGHGKLFSKALNHAIYPGSVWKEVMLS